MDSTEINTSNRSTTVNTPNSSSVSTTSNRSTTVTPSDNRRTVVNTLAIVGFVALIGVSMWLAVYSTRYVPGVVGRLGSAAVYLGSVLTPSPEPTLSIVPTPTASSTIISFGEASSTISTNVSSATSKVVATPAPSKPVTNWTPGTPVDITNGAISSPAPTNYYYGSPDLEVKIETVGYTVDGNIIAATTIPAYTQGAVKFRVTNIGTNVSGPWTVHIVVPGKTLEQTMGPLVPAGPGVPPNEYIVYFINVASGTNLPIVITIDSNQIAESSTANNADSRAVTIL
ncbi:MAG: hypothetical protein Q7R90_00110 [bacterium]|nr:hypothetical protein [bacterium]